VRKQLTLGRRARIVEILSTLGDGVGVDVKARKIERCLGEPCSFNQALSLLGQFRAVGSRRKAGKTRAQINEERFQRQKAARPDLYR